MSSTDGEPDEPGPPAETAGEFFVEPVVRRSTYTPPTARFDAAGGSQQPDVHDDDELARALAEDLSRVATGAIPVVSPFAETVMPDAASVAPAAAEEAAEPQVDHDEPEFSAPRFQVPGAPPEYEIPVSFGERIPPADEWMPRANEQQSPGVEHEDSRPVFDLQNEPPLFQQPVFEQPVFEQPVFEQPVFEQRAPEAPQAFPTPEEQAAALAQHSAPAGRPWTPERKSLPDEQLMSMLEAASQPGSQPGMVDELQAQMRLRDEEAREYQEWEQSMLAVGTPEALDVVQKVRPSFAGLVPTESPATRPVDDEHSAEFAGAAPPPAEVPPAEAPPAFDARPVFEAAPTLPPMIVEPPALVEPPPAPVAPPALPEPWFIPASTMEHAPEETVEAPEPPVTEPEVPSAASVPLQFDDFLTGGQGGQTFGEQHPFIDTHTGAVPTGSVTVVPPQPLDEVDDDVDETDRAFGGLFAVAPGEPAHPATAPVEPIFTPRVAEDEVVVLAAEARSAPAFSSEKAGAEPTPEDQRVGRALRMFWLWFAANSSIVSIGFGAGLFALGMSLRQALIAAVIGVALSCLPLGLGTLAGKRSGQPTMIVSRAAFGVVGNVVPAALALLTRVFWGAVLLWLLASSTAFILIGAELGGPLGYDQLVIIGLAVGFLLAIVVAFFGYSLLARFQLVVSILSGILVVGLIALTWQYVDVSAALSVVDGDWILLLSGVVLVFSFIGLVWANSSADLARYQRPGASGPGSMLSATLGATLPTFALIAYGALLAASSPALATGLADRPLDAIATLLPLWYPVPLVAATVLSLLSGVVISIYSAGFSLQAVGVRLPRNWATLIVGLLLFFGAWVLSIMDVDLSGLFRDVATTFAVPVAAWAGIFAADTMIRKRRYHAPSLLQTGGVYPSVNWVNLSMLIVITGIGYGFTTAAQSWLSWQGYGFTLLGIPGDGQLAGTDLGVLAALVLGILTPIVSGSPTIRRQESVDALSN